MTHEAALQALAKIVVEARQVLPRSSWWCEKLPRVIGSLGIGDIEPVQDVSCLGMESCACSTLSWSSRKITVRRCGGFKFQVWKQPVQTYGCTFLTQTANISHRIHTHLPSQLPAHQLPTHGSQTSKIGRSKALHRSTIPK